MDATKNFDLGKAFMLIDDWNYGYIDKTNLKSFLKKHNFLPTTSEALAIIRRLDLDADARLSKQEFIDGLYPVEPYSKLLKREEMNRGLKPQGNLAKHQMDALKEGKMLVLDNDSKSILRTQAMERS